MTAAFECPLRVGQSVIYRPQRGAQYYGQELAAIVCAIKGQGKVNLVIFDPNGNAIKNPPQYIPLTDMDYPEVHEMSFPNGSRISGAFTETNGQVPQMPMPELPPGAKLVENRPATPQEVAKAKAGMKKTKRVKK